MAMDKRVHFGTKEEHNARREQAFLALTPAERFMWFLRSFAGPRPAHMRKAKQDKGNFVINKDGPVR
ncbi:MAG TPA: hypothetical protein PKD45_09480 [Flavobacteriales bacterium]|nr:hypothetical protein [Flavobacteriales bacterium]